MITELIAFVVKRLVSRPDDVVITLSKRDAVDVIEIKVDPADKGRVIGREGNTIKTLRMLVEVAAHNNKFQIELLP